MGLDTNRLDGGFYLALPPTRRSATELPHSNVARFAERPRLGIGIAPSFVAQRMRRAVGLPDRAGAPVREVGAKQPGRSSGHQTKAT